MCVLLIFLPLYTDCPMHSKSAKDLESNHISHPVTSRPILSATLPRATLQRRVATVRHVTSEDSKPAVKEDDVPRRERDTWQKESQLIEREQLLIDPAISPPDDSQTPPVIPPCDDDDGTPTIVDHVRQLRECVGDTDSCTLERLEECFRLFKEATSGLEPTRPVTAEHTLATLRSALRVGDHSRVFEILQRLKQPRNVSPPPPEIEVPPREGAEDAKQALTYLVTESVQSILNVARIFIADPLFVEGHLKRVIDQLQRGRIELEKERELLARRSDIGKDSLTEDVGAILALLKKEPGVTAEELRRILAALTESEPEGGEIGVPPPHPCDKPGEKGDKNDRPGGWGYGG